MNLSAAGVPLDRTAIIIQSHVIAMYLPSLASGYIMDRLGVARVLLVGVAGMTASIVVGVYAARPQAFWAALVLLGLGWNMLFLGGTVLLARRAAGAARLRLQAINDFGVFGAQALASLSAGTALVLVGWDALNLAALPLLAWVAITVLVRRSALSGTARRPAVA